MRARLVDGGGSAGAGSPAQVHDIVDPLRIRAARRDLLLQLLVGDDAALRQVDEEELAGLEAALTHDVLRPLVGAPVSDASTTQSAVSYQRPGGGRCGRRRADHARP